MRSNENVIFGKTPDSLLDDQRPYLNPSTLPSTIYVETTGDDDNGDGSSANPIKTMERAIQMVGMSNPSTKTVQFGAGTFDVPGTLSEINWITFIGTESTEETRNITTVHHATEDELISVTVDGSALSDDEWRGRLIEYVGGAANARRGWVWRNTGNRLWITQDKNLDIAVPTTSDDISLISQDTTLNLTTTVVAKNSTQYNIQKVKFTGNKVWFFLTTDKVELKHCHSHINRFQSGGDGRAFFSGCYIANIGVSPRGFHTLTNDGFNRWDQGTVFDTENCVANADYIGVQTPSF